MSRDDLIAQVWDGRIVSESALGTCINAARTAIGDSGEAQRLIKTLPRKGIRFVGSVRDGEKSEAFAADATEPPRPALALPDRPSIAVLPSFRKGRFEDAVLWARRALDQNPRVAQQQRFLAASLAHLGQREKAAAVVQQILKEDPHHTLAKLRTRTLGIDEGIWSKLAEGLRLAGLPD